MAQARCALTIGRKAGGWKVRRKGGGGGTGYDGNDAAEVCVQVGCDVPVAEMTVMNGINI